jgi:dipeptidyl aminopeptidase/acylaminoacyl peptidase
MFRFTRLLIPTIALCASAAAQPALQHAIDTLFKGTSFSHVAISPDGAQVAWVESAPGGTAIFVSQTAGAHQPRRITAGGKSETALAWSRDSKQLAFLSDGPHGNGQQQLYVVNATGGAARKLTTVKGYLSSPRWSPDGNTIAVLFIQNAARAAGPLVAEVAQTGVIKEAVTEQRLALIPASGGTLRQISPANMYVYEYDWSPDSRRFITSAAHGNGDNNWWVAQLYTLDVSNNAAASHGSEADMHAIYKPALQIANPVWSPDGKSVAFIEGLMSDEGMTGGDIFLVSAEGSAENNQARNLTPEMKASATSLAWPRSGGKITFAEDVDGDTGVASIDPASSTIETIYRGPEFLLAEGAVASVALAADAKSSAVIRQSFSHPPEVWAGAIGHWKQVSSRNAALKPAWGETKSIHWTNDNFNVQGWLLFPEHFDANKKYPMVVLVHGGPSSMTANAWPGSRSMAVPLSAAGYFVFFPNPRGSYGQGEAFTRANVKDFGYGDFHDVLTGVDAVEQQAPVDDHRLGITGWSYGGYMTMWAVTQTQRFSAAVAGAGLFNWQSYYGENQIDQWMIPFFGNSVYDDPEIYARSAPITFIKRAKTPTLILVGDSDGECPTPQSYEFWHALKTLDVETELVVYEHEGHAFAKPAHQRDVLERTASWFNDHLK